MIRPTRLSRPMAALLVAGSLAGLSVHAQEPASTASAELTAAGGPSLSIAPLRIELDSGVNGSTMYLSNTSSREVAVQSRLFAWSQAAGEDVYAPSSELTISPSISMIPPGETQIVRVLRKPGSAAGEKRFRLVVDQLPDPKAESGAAAATRIRFSLPVFVDSDTAGAPSFVWRLTDDRIELANVGGATARVAKVSAKAPGVGDVALGQNNLRYVHGGSTISWPVGKGCSLGAVEITAQIDGQTVDARPVSSCS